MRLTVGPLPAAVYWRRRALVLGAALLVVFLVAQACLGASAEPGGEPGAGPPSQEPGSTIGGGLDFAPPTGSPDPTSEVEQVDSEEPSTSPPDGEACTDEELRVSAEVRGPDGEAVTEFAAGDAVEFWIVIRNGSGRACVRNIGGDHRELYLIQGTGADRVWTSRDCAPPAGDDEQELVPGFESSYYLVWNGRASSACDDGKPGGDLVEPGTYQLYARLGSDRSEPVELTIR